MCERRYFAGTYILELNMVLFISQRVVIVYLWIKLFHFVGRQYFVRFAEAVALVWSNTFVIVSVQ